MKKEFSTENPVFGLVLVGGQSCRMGRPKELMDWHGQTQQFFLAELLNTRCEKVFISCRTDQVAILDTKYFFLNDLEEDKGPLMAIHSAFVHKPNVAWLVLACDLPYFGKEALDFLLENRNEAKMATCYKSPIDGIAEPLCAIWEPAMATVISDAITRDKRSPRKLLEQVDVQLIEPIDPKILLNVNTPEEAEAVARHLKRQKS